VQATVVGGQGFDSEVSEEPLWDSSEKVMTVELGPYLESQPAAA
jgi:hypothetical protein